MDFKGKKVVIMGLGSYDQGSGIAAARFFARAGAKVLVTDLKPKEVFVRQLKKLAGYRTIKYIFGKHRKIDFQMADIIVKNPDVPVGSPYLAAARKRNIPIHNDWSIFFFFFNNPLVGVTGTRGKTTTATLLNEFLKEHYETFLCGNVGVSPLAVIEKVKPGNVVVAELSSWNLQQLPAVKKGPHIAVITNLLVDHLNKYKNLNEYYKDKENIFKYQTHGDFLVVNRDDAQLRKRVKKARSRVFWFSQKPFAGDGVFVRGGNIVFRADGKEAVAANVSDVRLKGSHNLENICAAVCAAMITHVSPVHIKKVLRAFTGVSSRLELVREIGGVKYYNDTTATTPDAAIAALRALKSKRMILLAGGTDKKLDYRAYAKEVKKRRPFLVLFAGTAADKIRKELKNYSHILGVVQSMKEAMRMARPHIKKGDIVLLSPGAASFGIFKNEFDRGVQFVKEVHLLHKK
ncbi:UDP-N-acetylmuramoyl-L-alanine--D-glutamate ligase [Candidatus Azambacteria bacterium]|nr:UDP-N-acetylmuramoyl-L-alanine--D-glutamate ligase [Candidatus Azambacteria bacterium]